MHIISQEGYECHNQQLKVDKLEIFERLKNDWLTPSTHFTSSLPRAFTILQAPIGWQHDEAQAVVTIANRKKPNNDLHSGYDFIL